MRDKLHFDPAEVAVEAVGDIDRAGRELHLEIGFGKDIRILREAQGHAEAVYLGVEISGKKARKFREKVARRDLRNVFCYHGDVRAVLGEMLDVALGPCEEVVEAQHLVSFAKESLAEMRAEKSRATGD